MTSNYGIKFAYNVDNVRGGPLIDIANQNGELKGIKIAIVMTVINPQYGDNAPVDNGFGAGTLSYSYSGIYTQVDPSRYNIKTVIDKSQAFNKLHEDLPAVKYVIYGFSSFALADGSGCTSFSLDATLNSVSSYTISLNQKSYVKAVTLQADLYFPQTQGVCSPGVEFDTLTTSVADGEHEG